MSEASLVLASGLRIDDPHARLLAFLAEEHAYYDAIPCGDPNRVEVNDVLAAAMMNAFSFGVGAAKLRAIHRGLATACDPLLAQIPVDARLEMDDLGVVEQVLAEAVAVPNVLIPVATKVLHRKRPALIPMLDNVVIDYYLEAAGMLGLRAGTQDKKRAAAVAAVVLEHVRADLVHSAAELGVLAEATKIAGYPVEPLRALEILVWIQVEPRGYYRTST